MAQINPKTNSKNTANVHSASAKSYQAIKPLELAGKEHKPKRSGLSLRRQLFLTIVPTVLVPLVIASLSGYYIIQKRVQKQIKAQLSDQALLTGELTSKLLEDALKIPEMVAANPLVINAARTGSKEAEAVKLNQMPIAQVERQFETTKLLKPNQLLNDYLRRSAKIGGLAELFFTEQNGFNIAYSNPTSDFVQRDERWWQKGKSETRWFSDIDFDESAKTFGVELSLAIADPDSGEFLGVIKALLPSSRFGLVERDLKHAGISGSQQVQLLDISAEGIIYTITAEGLFDTQQVVGGEVVLQIAAALVRASQVESINPEQEVSKLPTLPQKLTIIPLTYETGEEVLAASFIYGGRHYTVATLPRTNWVAVASMDSTEIAAAGREFVGVFVLSAAVLGVVAVLIVLRLANQLSAPMRNLSSTAEQVASGNMNVFAEPRGTIETQTLAQSFNNLVVQVKGLLSKQVAETRRTQLLADIARARQSEELESPFNQLLEEVCSTLKADRIVIYRFNPDGSGYIVAESVVTEWPSALGDKIEDSCIGSELLQAYKNGRVVAIRNVSEADFHPEHLQLMERLQIKSNLVTPILQGEKLYGLLIAHHCDRIHDWQHSEIDYLVQIANQLGLALSGFGLLEEKQVEAERQREQKEALQRELSEFLNDVEGASSGDLTVRAEITAGEIGIVADFFNSIIESLREIVTQVKQAASQVNSSVGENEGAIRLLADEAIKQATQISQTLNSVEEMALSIQEVADNARAAAEVARAASARAQTGGAAMERTVESILQLRETVASTAKKVKRLGESSQKISQVVSLINQIALKTNLLAVNASIEAARAGKEGRGFAVVAEEVSELAEQSAAATKEIQQIVASIQLGTSEVVQAMEVGTAQVVEGTSLVEEAKQSLGQIVEVSRQIDQLLQSISSATVSQAQTSESVTKLMNEIAQVSEHTSEESRQVSSSLQQTVAIAQQLQASVGMFKVGTHAKSG
ncbi:MAG: methyl-accepting chemotaxis protein [Xenococcaceae cyanobacterium]